MFDVFIKVKNMIGDHVRINVSDISTYCKYTDPNKRDGNNYNAVMGFVGDPAATMYLNESPEEIDALIHDARVKLIAELK